MVEYEVVCCECGEYFELSCPDGSLGWANGICPHCGENADHEIVDQESD